MLNWFFSLFRRPREAPAPRPSVSDLHVRSDEKQISVADNAGSVSTMAWADVGNVAVLTTDGGPTDNDLFWILNDKDHRQSLIVPLGADGEHELLQAMQARLAGFDDMAVVEAMSSTSNGVFQIWPPADIAP